MKKQNSLDDHIIRLWTPSGKEREGGEENSWIWTAGQMRLKTVPRVFSEMPSSVHKR